MSEMGINAARNNLGINFLELIDTIRESQNFGWAYECAEIRFMNDIICLFVHAL